MNSDDPLDPEMIQAALSWRPGGPPLSQEVRVWLAMHHPDCVHFRINEEALQAEIKRLQEAGIEITPDIFPGLRLTRKFRPKGEGWTVSFGDE